MYSIDESDLGIDGAKAERLEGGGSEFDEGRVLNEALLQEEDQRLAGSEIQPLKTGEDLNAISSVALDALAAGRKDSKKKEKEMSRVERAVADTFDELDTYFTGDKLPSLQKEEFKYMATGMTLRDRLEIPIIIQSPETVVSYEFSADPPNLKFGITFIAALGEGETLDDLELEEVEEIKLVNSRSNQSVDAEGNAAAYSYQGSFVVGDEGVIFLIFDVDDSWSLFNNGSNILSYNVKVVQPTFAYVDELRCEHALSLLQEGEEESGLARSNHADLTTNIMKTTSEIERMEVQIFSFKSNLARRRRRGKPFSRACTGIWTAWRRDTMSSMACVSVF